MGEHVEQIVEVVPIISTTPNELFYYEPNDIGGVFIRETEGVEWWGPIPDAQDLEAIVKGLFALAALLNIPDDTIGLLDEIIKKVPRVSVESQLMNDPL